MNRQEIISKLREYNKQSLNGFFNDTELNSLTDRFGGNYDNAIQSLFTLYTSRISKPTEPAPQASGDILETVTTVFNNATNGSLPIGVNDKGQILYSDIPEPVAKTEKKFPWFLVLAGAATVYALTKKK